MIRQIFFYKENNMNNKKLDFKKLLFTGILSLTMGAGNTATTQQLNIIPNTSLSFGSIIAPTGPASLSVRLPYNSDILELPLANTIPSRNSIQPAHRASFTVTGQPESIFRITIIPHGGSLIRYCYKTLHMLDQTGAATIFVGGTLNIHSSSNYQNNQNETFEIYVDYAPQAIYNPSSPALSC